MKTDESLTKSGAEESVCFADSRLYFTSYHESLQVNKLFIVTPFWFHYSAKPQAAPVERMTGESTQRVFWLQLIHRNVCDLINFHA